MTRTRTVLTLTTLGLAGLLALPGCGAPADATAGVTDEAIALQTVGLEAAPSPSPSASAEPAQKGGKGVRKFLRKNTLHGETTVQGRDGVRTIVVQRGTVTAAGETAVTVKSTDGFTLTWTPGDKLRVVHDKKKVGTDAVKVGTEVGVAGTRTGDTTTARLIVVQ
jgi:hypothetical protein